MNAQTTAIQRHEGGAQQPPTSIAQRQQTAPAPYVGQPLSIQETMRLAGELAKSGIVKTSRPETALAIILRGREAGFQPMESFEFIDVIEGRPQISPRGHLSIIYRSGLLEELDIKPSEPGKPIACTVTMKRKGGPRVTKTFTLEMAQKAGLVKEKSAWKSYPEQMCQWRAIGFASDFCFPDLTGGGGTRLDGINLDREGNIDAGGAQYAGSEAPPTSSPSNAPNDAVDAEFTAASADSEAVDDEPEADLTLLDLQNALATADYSTVKALAKEVDAAGLRLVMAKATEQYKAKAYTPEQTEELGAIIHARKAELGI